MRRYIAALAIVAGCAAEPSIKPAALEERAQLSDSSNDLSSQKEVQSLAVALMIDRVQDILAHYDPQKLTSERRESAIEHVARFHSFVADYRRMVRGDARQDQLDKCYGALMLTSERIIFDFDAHDITIAGPYHAAKLRIEQ